MRTQAGGEVPASHLFVGRAPVLAEIDAALEVAVAGHGSVVLVSGDAGIGKTQLATEVAERARTRGMLALRGACWEGSGAPAYWPWTQILRGWMAAADRPRPEDLGIGWSALAPLAPDHGPVHTVTGHDDPERDRLRLFDALTSLLLRSAERQPLFLVLDDLQWADTPSVLALQFLAGEVHRGRLVVLGAYRDVEVGRGSPVGEALAATAVRARCIALSGMREHEVACLIALVRGADPAPDEVTAVTRHTGGNPLFVRELVRLGVTDLAPAGVREVIERRVRLLPADTQAALEVAAVIGEEFSLEVLASAAGSGRVGLLPAVEAAVAARLLIADPGSPGHHRFSHALIRDVVYQGLVENRRAQLHGRVGEALEARHAASGDHLAAIASHYVRAAPLGRADRALRLARQAGEHAMALLGWEEAATHFEHALHMLDLDPLAAGPEVRTDLHLRLGAARACAGATDAARRAFRAAADGARASGDTARFASAALGLGQASPVWGVDPELVELLEQARDALGEHGDAHLRARVLARLAQALYYLVPAEVRDALSREAVELARASCDDGALADALTARRVLWGPDDLAARAALSDELVTVGHRTGDLDLEVRGRSWRVVDLVESGNVAAARAEILRHEELASRLHQPTHLRDGLIWRAMLALLDGRFEDADAAADAAHAAGERTQDPGADAIHEVQKAMILAEQADPNRLDEAIRLARAGSQAHPDIPAWRALLAFAEARAGRIDDARADLEAAAGDGFAGVPRDTVFLVTLAHAADAAAITEHREVAGSLRSLLVPFADRWVVIDRGLACKGSTERLLGLLDGVLGDHDPAVERLERALGAHVRGGAHAFAARTRRELASALLARGGPGDADRAAALLAEAEADAQRLGMPGLAEEVDRARRTVAPSELPAAGRSLFRLDGEYWTVAHAGRTVRVKDAKGLRDIAVLLAHPGRETHVLDLMGGGTSARVPDGADSELLDAQARRAYRARLDELHEIVEVADAAHDLERAAQARAEAAFLVDELASALGLGGRARRTSGPTERARKAVTWRIRAGIDRIEHVHPELGRHLRHAIRTGTFCSYAPEHAHAWEVWDRPPS